jgi:TPR repeat protein
MENDHKALIESLFIKSSKNLSEESLETLILLAYLYFQNLNRKEEIHLKINVNGKNISFDCSADIDFVIENLEFYVKGLCHSEGIVLEKSDIKAFQNFKIAADGGDAICQNKIGCYYAIGKGVRSSPENAFKYFKLAADQGHKIAIKNLSECFSNGFGVHKSKAGEILYFSKVVSESNINTIRALHNYILEFCVSYKDIQEDIENWKLLAREGWSIANLWLAKIYLFIEPTFSQPKEDKLLEKIYKDEGLFYLTTAANLGNAEAQLTLGRAYKKNKFGLNSNSSHGMYYLKLAADQGLAPAQFEVGYYLFQMNLKKEAFQYFNLAAENKHIKAIFFLGICYYNGDGIKKSSEKAFNYFKFAADQECEYAHYYLGLLYFYGDGIELSYSKAFYHFKIAADNTFNDQKANFLVGMCYKHGYGTTASLGFAKRYFTAAARNGHPKALKEINE